jgi:hypothetical protein
VKWFIISLDKNSTGQADAHGQTQTQNPHRPEPPGRHPQNLCPLSAFASYFEMNILALLDIS